MWSQGERSQLGGASGGRYAATVAGGLFSRRGSARDEQRPLLIGARAGPFRAGAPWVKEEKGDRLRAWYGELKERHEEAFQTLDNEGVRQEVAFILNTTHGELLCVFLEIDKDTSSKGGTVPSRSGSATWPCSSKSRPSAAIRTCSAFSATPP